MWRRLCPRSEMGCHITLQSGQVFSWRQIQGQWLGVVDRHVVALREVDADIEYSCLNEPEADTKLQNVLHSYFRLDDNLSELYHAWMEPEDKFSPAFRSLPGLRLIRQNPLECLFSFICSSNNNISRVTQMLDKLRAAHGDALGTYESVPLHAFPTLAQLRAIEEADLRTMGFGYRAQYIVKSAKILEDLGGDEYLAGLRQNPDAAHVQSALTQFSGVGRKVADCIALFSLDKLEAIPVDTHVWQIACRDFRAKAHKSLTPTVYAEVGKLYQDRFTPFAGWAHSVLFAAELAAFRPAKTSPSTKRKKAEVEPAPAKKAKRIRTRAQTA
ncbi:N-glycosylase/DNA lyase [Achlya hypogyna]|uniref:DNA-(apurinic or apyrimidinic site) lyase n=1 Tax=Achlya hypogyna TaxID=1202772 RepID=A0A1V9ZIQ5_ACHHY|nr:N-glycosylase/DNA lyase [Achlya hypogyna]